MKRRSFLQGIGGAIGAVVAGKTVAPDASSSKPVIGVDLADGPDKTAIVAHTPSGYVELDATATGGFLVPADECHEILQQIQATSILRNPEKLAEMRASEEYREFRDALRSRRQC